MNDGEFPGLREAASRSSMLRAAGAAMNRVAAARGRSATWPWLKAGHAAFVALPGREQFRLCARTFAWAAIIYWGALAVLPPYTARWLPARDRWASPQSGQNDPVSRAFVPIGV